MKDNSSKKNKATSPKSKKKPKALLLGLGLDSRDDHLRITRGSNFQLVGGSEETHEAMQETAIKFNEELKRRHKHLAELEPREFIDIIQKAQNK